MNEFKLVLMRDGLSVGTLEAVEEFMKSHDTRVDLTDWIAEQMQKALENTYWPNEDEVIEQAPDVVSEQEGNLRRAIANALLAETIFGRRHFVTVSVDGKIETTNRMPYFGEWYDSHGVKHGENPKGGAA